MLLIGSHSKFILSPAYFGYSTVALGYFRPEFHIPMSELDLCLLEMVLLFLFSKYRYDKSSFAEKAPCVYFYMHLILFFFFLHASF